MAGLDTTLDGMLSLCVIFLFLTTATVILRFLARVKQSANFQVDDWIIVAAWLFFVGLNALIFYGIHLKYIGYKEPVVKSIINAEHPTVVKVFLVLDGLGIITLGLTKLSALFFYRRIFCSTGQRDIFNIVSGILALVVVIWTIVFFVLTLNFCVGHNIQYNFPVGNSANCKLIYPWFEASTTSDFGLDVLILALPIPRIWSLHTNASRKIAISGVFMLALVGLAASIARMVFLLHIVKTGRTINDVDGYQSNTQVAYFLILETGMTILAVNMPSLWYYHAGVTPERVLRSVRSIVSLASGRASTRGESTKGSKRSIDQTARDAVTARSIDTTSSRSNLTKHGSTSEVETYAMADLPIKHTIQDPEGIRVDRNFHRVEEKI
ncbi:hypothetical protein B7494_g8026 [Chlorociboria aeruginascens]|nr:hypothetical protein B7494_g8026 [Chlorociboria aeruginascens]